MGNLEYLLYGLLVTCAASLVGVVIGIPLGLAIALCRVKRIPVLSPLLAVYVSFIRSLPLVLLVLWLYFGMPMLGIDLNAFVAGSIALALNHSAFISEIWRSSIMNFPVKQIEAAKAYGLTDNHAFVRIILPQVWRTSLPAIANEITFIIKASPAIGVIGIDDLTRRASKLAASNFQPLAMTAIAMLLYIIVLFAVTRLTRRLDYRLQQRYELV
ncbi:amino acid ABC transporter permease [Pleurocapsa sp. FMAR1]|uniref:amino acid ABC transporter permease n=1 Tax=Pleurocapsa sp. FMAR1 TaxID=3040204 RepID=UPI0029C6348D|nr:amino acid ABC transporter permease [Pleurocapsa sp. FMAR1]